MEKKTGLKEEKLTFEKIWLMSKETEQRSKEADKRSKKADKRSEEADKRSEEADKRMNKLEELFVGQWGKLIESLVEGKLVELLRERRIDVITTHARSESKYKEKDIEIDIIAVNDEELVAVEVKTTLQLADVNDFIEKLKIFKKAFKAYKDKKIYGAVAYLRANSSADRYADKKGLFVIRATGDSASITNKTGFKPKIF